MITEIDENFQEAVIKLYESKSEEDMKIDKDDPFFSALNVPGSDIDWTKEENRVVTDLDQDLEPIEVDQN